MIRQGFLSYHRYKYLWLNVLGLVLLAVVYVLHDPIGEPSGGTILGYTYGGIATAGILYLMWYGIRKRSFYAKRTTLLGSLAAHVWIGIALIFVVPLHSGFQFGINVHTLAYVLMLVVIFSGIWGAVMYSKLPLEIRSQRGGGSLKQLLEQISAISSDIDRMSSSDGGEKSDTFLAMLQRIDFEFVPSLAKSLRHKSPAPIERKQMAALLSDIPREEQEEALKAIGLINKKRELVERVQDETRALTWVRLWLFIHLPVSFGLVVCLAIHIFSVFYLW